MPSKYSLSPTLHSAMGKKELFGGKCIFTSYRLRIHGTTYISMALIFYLLETMSCGMKKRSRSGNAQQNGHRVIQSLNKFGIKLNRKRIFKKKKLLQNLELSNSLIWD